MTVARLSRLLDFLAQDPHNAALLGEVADEQLNQGDSVAARATLQQLLAVQPGDALTRYRLAVATRAGGDAATAVAALQALLAEGHAHAVVVQELARAQGQLGDWAAVVATLEPLQAGALPPEEGDAVWLLRVRAHHHLGQLTHGLAQAQDWEAARAGALPLQGRAAIATLMLDAERLEDAARVLAHVEPKLVDGHAELAAAAGFVQLGQGEARGAMDRFTQSVQLDASLGRAHLGLGLAMASQGDLPRALDALRAAVTATPSHLGSWHALAWVQLLQDDLAGAQASFESALAQDDTFGETHGGLALLAALRGDVEASERHLRTASRLDPQSTHVLVTRAVLERGPEHDGQAWLAQALERFMGVAARRNPALQAMLERALARARG